jgi:DNA-binding Xre family transcriptional regulator
MRFSYNKLWKLLIDKDLSKKELAVKSNISVTSISKLKKGANVNTEILLKICIALNCGISDIMEIVKE